MGEGREDVFVDNGLVEVESPEIDSGTDLPGGIWLRRLAKPFEQGEVGEGKEDNSERKPAGLGGILVLGLTSS
jgi:hypothetical protein